MKELLLFLLILFIAFLLYKAFVVIVVPVSMIIGFIFVAWILVKLLL